MRSLPGSPLLPLQEHKIPGADILKILSLFEILLDSLARGHCPIGQVFASWDVVHTDLRREYRVLRLPGARGVQVIY